MRPNLNAADERIPAAGQEFNIAASYVILTMRLSYSGRVCPSGCVCEIIAAGVILFGGGKNARERAKFDFVLVTRRQKTRACCYGVKYVSLVVFKNDSLKLMHEVHHLHSSDVFRDILIK
jgi:hypothetical protein